MERAKNINNIGSIMDALNPEDIPLKKSAFFTAKGAIAGKELLYNADNIEKVEQLPNGGPLAKAIKNARYNWVFDDLQEFTDINLENIESRDELENVLREIYKDNTKRQGGASKFASALWLSVGRENKKIKQALIEGESDTTETVYERLSFQRANKLSKGLNPKKAKTLFAAASDENAFSQLVKRFDASDKEFKDSEIKLIIRRTDRRGVEYHYNLATGHRASNPMKNI